MDSELRKTLSKLVLEIRHLLEGYYDDRGVLHAGDLEQRLNQIGAWRDRPAKPLEELPQLSEADNKARRIIDAYIKYREETGINRSEAIEEFIRESAYNWFNRLFALRCMEARGIIDEVILQKDIYGGRSLQHNRLAISHPELCAGEDDGLYVVLFQEFEQITHELPMLFNPVSPAGALRPSVSVVKSLVAILSGREPVNSGYATDEMFIAPDAFGWAYQYWNAEEKDRVFEKVRTEKTKIEGKDIIPVTCIYTEPYMVKFLVQNSLGAQWSCMHPKSLLYENWEYYVRDADRSLVDLKPVQEITFLDPACGSGHFLLEAFDLFYAMYMEEGKLLGPEEICASILENNLYGIDIDERAVQISIAVLWMKAKEKSSELDTSKLSGFHEHLVATNIQLPRGRDHLKEFLRKHPEDLPLESALKSIFEALENVDEIGSLLKIEEPLEYAFESLIRNNKIQMSLWSNGLSSVDSWRESVIRQLQQHFNEESVSSDISQSFFGQSVNSGLKLVELLSKQYDIVATNPPYMGFRNIGLRLKKRLQSSYYNSGNDLYGCFITQCGRLGKTIAMVSMNSYLFLKSFRKLREELLKKQRPIIVAELGTGAFQEIGGEVVNVVLTIFEKNYLAQRVKTIDATILGYNEKVLKLLEKNEIKEVRYEDLEKLVENPFIFRAIPSFYDWLSNNQSIGDIAECIVACKTSNNDRFIRYWWELPWANKRWVLYEKEAIGYRYHSSPLYVIDWSMGAQYHYRNYFSAQLPHEKYLFREAIVTSKISGVKATARILSSNSLADMAVNEIILHDDENKLAKALCALLNSAVCVYSLRQLNPTINSQPIDLQRIPFVFILRNDIYRKELHEIWENGFKLITNILSMDTSRIEYNFKIDEYNNLNNFIYDQMQKYNKYISGLNSLKIKLDSFIEQCLSLTDDDINEIKKVIYYDQLDEHFSNDKNSFNDIQEETSILDFSSSLITFYILSLLGHRWPKQIEVSEPVLDYSDPDGIIPMTGGTDEYTLLNRIRERINENFENSSTSIERDIEELMGKSLKEWLLYDFFKYHTKQFKNSPPTWQIQSTPLVSSRRGSRQKVMPAFACLVYCQKVDRDTLHKIRSQYVGPLKNGYEAELRTLETIGLLNAEQTIRQTKLEMLIDELEEFDAKLQSVIKGGFDSKELEKRIRDEPLDKWCSIDGKEPPPDSREGLYLQERAYVPDVNDGVRVNIAPLQKAGLLSADVLDSKDVDRAISDRAEWRADERRWCREGKLPQPGWWEKRKLDDKPR